jgi:prevent-host-death family protein
MAEEMGVAELKRRFSELLGRVELKREAFVVMKRGRRVAALIPLDQAFAARRETEAVGPGRGLLAAVGAWVEHDDIEGFVDDIRRSRDAAHDRDVGGME